MKTRKAIAFAIILVFLATTVKSPAYAGMAEDLMPRLPEPGEMVHLSPGFTSAYLQGITIHPENAFQFDFLVHKGDQDLTGDQKSREYKQLVKYFLTSLTIPDDDQWVNLSPYENDRIIRDDFGKTRMGRDLLAEDYLLKQITSSLIYPEDGLGKKFWDRVYERAWKEYGTAEVPVDTFNKVWIVPDQAIVYESGNSAYIIKSHLKVMLQQDYLSLKKHDGASAVNSNNNIHAIASQVIREIVLPELEREVNEGRNFAKLRQMYSGMILAVWYKKVLRDSLLGKIYADKARIKGVDQDPKAIEAIYQRYLKAFKKGVFNYIKEDGNKYSNEPTPRKYFSGGWEGLKEAEFVSPRTDFSRSVGKEFIADKASIAFIPPTDITALTPETMLENVAVVIDPQGNKPESVDSAMTTELVIDAAKHAVRFFNLKYSREFRSPDFYLSKDKEVIVNTWIEPIMPVLSADEFQKFMSVARQFAGNTDGADLLLAALESHRPAVSAILDRAMMVKAQTIIVASRDLNLSRMISSDLGSRDVRVVTATSLPEAQRAMSEGASLLIVDTRYGQIQPDIATGTIPVFALSLGLEDMKAWKGKNVSIFDLPYSGKEFVGSIRKVLARDAAMVGRVERISPVSRIGENRHSSAEAANQKEDKNTIAIDVDEGLAGRGFGILKEGILERLKSGQGRNMAILKINGNDIRVGRMDRDVDAWAQDIAERSINLLGLNKGGIDLNSVNLDLQIKRDRRGAPLAFDRQDMSRLNRIQGFVPEIIEIQPAVNLPIWVELRQELQAA